MSNPEIEPKPIVGDDGELIEGDTSFTRIEYIDVPATPPQLLVAIRIGKWLLYAIIAIFSTCALWWMVTRPSDKFYRYQYEPPYPTYTPAATSFPYHPSSSVSNLQPPAAGVMLTWESHLTGIHTISWAADQTQLAITYGGQNLLAIWNIKSGQYTVKQSDISAFDWSTENAQQFVAASNNSIDVYDSGAALTRTTALKLPVDFTLPASAVKWSIDGSHIAALSQDRKTLAIFDATGELQLEKLVQQPISDIRWSPVKPLLLGVQSKGLLYLQPADTHLAQEQQEWSIPTQDNVSWQMATFSPDGAQVALAGHDCDAHLAVFNTLQPSTNWVERAGNYGIPICSKDSRTFIAWSPTSNKIAGFIQGDDAVHFWDSTTGKVTDRIFPQRGLYVTSIAWSHDGRYLAMSTNTAVTLWSPS